MPPESASTWPTVIGVIALVFGIVGTLGGVWTAVSPLFVEAMMKFVPQGQPTGMEAMQNSAPWLVLSGLGMTVLGIILIVGGIRLLQRRRRAIQTCRVWAVAKMVFVVANAIGNYSFQMESMATVQQQVPNTPAMPVDFSNIMSAMMVVTAVVMSLWGWALPIFLLIWFGRSKIKTETAEWT